ncbi:disease resistance protein Pik-2-like [Hordeum vulgare subsp. vulgare]|uniref:Uncharacterized protein n=1 Tax=Hordeum vulgare subsp. vulgare TaxID=112509 RepID=A0A287EH46_HORVV|nr:disease resistance protein Pik-2-like [Hordeum vulgare subsp. vulgare]
MEATALSIGKSVLDGALGYAKSALAEEVALQLGVRQDQVFITNELEMMQAFLMAAHEERFDDDRVVKVWVKQVRDVAYDVEDTLQEFAVRLKKQSWWRICRTLQDRRRVAKQMKDLRANVEDVSQRNMRYNLIKGPGSKAATFGDNSGITSAKMSAMDEGKRQHDKAKVDLIRLINKKDDNLRVIAVSGTSTGHLEKMSVIKSAYEDRNVHMKFECRAWITGFMCPFSLSEFLRRIIEQFHVNFLQGTGDKGKTTLEIPVLRRMGMMNEDDLVDEFTKYLSEKKYLIVLNGINTIKDWAHLKPCFRDSKKGSRIIVSAEQVGVASLCVGPDDAAPEYMRFFADENIYAFYEKGSQDGTDSMEAVSTSNADTASGDSSANMKTLNRTPTLLAAFKESKLIGRETEKREIVKLVTNVDSRQLEVISVWGMGGLGKTTLVRDVYQSQDLSREFEKRACVTVLRPFDLDALLKDLATQFGYNGVSEMDTKLAGHKYLIVLDDLSSNAEWDIIIPHFPAMETSSRIIVTTRVKGIAIHCSRKHENVYELQSLGHSSALDLFTEKVFGKTTNFYEQYPELSEPANLILKKCSGLPLAIVTIGGFLSNQTKSSLEWRRLNERMSTELEMNPELGYIRTVLMRSYDGLPYHLKSCFLYMPIFPEDYKVGRGRLARRWSAEGYSRGVRGKSAEEIADGYFMELISRSMILPSQQSILGRNGIGSCQVHDLIREIGVSKSMEENLVFTLEEGCSSNSQAMVRHLAISSNWEGDKNEFESTVDMSRLRSITCFGKWKSFFVFDKMRLLRVLDLEDTAGLYPHNLKDIGKLLHLRYLSLRGCGDISYLPDLLGNLRQLETLDVRDTWIVQLPKSIIKLRKLNYLRTSRKPANDDIEEVVGLPEEINNRPCELCVIMGICCLGCCAVQCIADIDLNSYDICTTFCCYGFPAVAMRLDLYGVLVPRGMRKLKNLHTLAVVNIGRQGKLILKDIEGLTQLRKLGVTGVNKVNGQELCSAIVGLSRLESLSIRSEGEPGLCGCLDGDFSFPETLQSLKLYGNLAKLPEWIQGLKNLVTLKLRSSRITEHDAAIQILGNLSNLVFLHLLEKSLVGEEVRLSFQKGMFPSLVVLELSMGYGTRLKSVKFEQKTTPRLEVLQFRQTAYIDSGFLSGLFSLASLKEVVLQHGYFGSELEYLRTELTKNPNLPVVKWVF